MIDMQLIKYDLSKACDSLCSTIGLALMLSTGFYGVTYYIGYREDFELDVRRRSRSIRSRSALNFLSKVVEIINRICELEQGLNPRDSSEIVENIRQAASSVTHL
jgi:KUP system potassium uptake protein